MLLLLSRVSNSDSSTPYPGANRKSEAPRKPPISTVVSRVAASFPSPRNVVLRLVGVPWTRRKRQLFPAVEGVVNIHFSNYPAGKSTTCRTFPNLSNPAFLPKFTRSAFTRAASASAGATGKAPERAPRRIPSRENQGNLFAHYGTGQDDSEVIFFSAMGPRGMSISPIIT
jgi:hypothetical protein